VRLFAATEQWFAFNEKDAWTLFHSYAFDFSVWELWGALLYGGKLVVVPYWVSRSPEMFHELLSRERVTILNQTPSAFRQLIKVDETHQGPRPLFLRTIIFGGEALELNSLRPWFERHGDQHPQLINMYGITETTVHVTYRLLTSVDLETSAGSVIGSSIPDLRNYLLDHDLQLVPVGVVGELCVGGDGLTRGYLNRPELTAERFAPDPFSTRPGARLYKSGDLARRLEDGDVEYIGRSDEQVKIRGFRIELGEIEAVLIEHAGVREAVVMVRSETTGEKRLVAYLTCGAGQVLTTDELLSYLKEKLPDYMIPAVFVQLDELPLTPNGKVDRHALPANEHVRPELSHVYVEPQTEAEKILAEVWTQVLGVEQIGIHDNYFALGGDSYISVC
jgi:acyl-coenzyme A synthetase/AMP-(fatty) acid ligase